MYATPDAFARALRRLPATAWTRRRTLIVGALAGLIAITSQAASALSRVDAGTADASVTTPASAQELILLQQAAATLSARYAGNRQALIEAGQAALHSGRNEATIAAMLRLRWVGRLNAGLEHYAAGLAATDPSRLALAVAGVQRYSELIHNGLLGDAPDQLVTVSLHDQRLLAYDRGRVVIDTLVTTGRAALPTDVGAMHVLSKDSPWTMHSPWPKGSPDWYPDTQVQMVVWFTKNGEGLHDASWQPPGTYGPGSTDSPYASHGCIHVPLSAETVLFNWAQLGTPVVVYPGDGTALDSQIAQQSVDAMGNPVSGIRGA